MKREPHHSAPGRSAVRELAHAIEHGRNALLIGRHGSGRQSLVEGVTARLCRDLRVVNAPTVELISECRGNRTVSPSIAPVSRHRFDANALWPAEVLYFHNLDQASRNIGEAVKELARFHSLGGQPLPRLRSVVASVALVGEDKPEFEPSAEHADTFETFVRLSWRPDRAHFAMQFGEEKGSALVDWWEQDLTREQQQKVTNRRLEMIGCCADDHLDSSKFDLDIDTVYPAEWCLPIDLLKERMHGLGIANRMRRIPQVFLSASSSDYGRARKLYDYLIKRGLSVFLADESLRLHGDANYGREVDRVLDRANHLVVVAGSPRAFNSKWVESEWRFFANEQKAGRKNGNLLTLAEGSMKPEALPPGLRSNEMISIGPGAYEKVWSYVSR